MLVFAQTVTYVLYVRVAMIGENKQLVDDKQVIIKFY